MCCRPVSPVALKVLNSEYSRVGVKYSTCTWYLYLSTYLSVLDVLEYLVYGNAKYLTKKCLVLTSNFQVLFLKKCKKG